MIRRTFGQIKPIVVSQDYVIAAGNGTYEAALALDWPALGCIVFPGTLDEARRYAITDNRTAELAEWDEAALIADLIVLPVELLASTGFTVDERDALARVREGTEVTFTAYDPVAVERQCPSCGFRGSGDWAPNDPTT